MRRLTKSTGFVYFASYTYFTSTYWPWVPNMGKCAGEEYAAFSGMGILSSYLLLFISFYLSTYKAAGKRAANKAVSNGEIAVDPKFTEQVIDSVQTNGKKNGSVRSRKA